jgi:c-di-GMP-binding flagellar brake protein YcgR
MRKKSILGKAHEPETKLMVNDLLLAQRPDDLDPGKYRSRIEDIVEEKLVINWPTEKGIRLPVRPDQMLSFSMTRDGNAYSFRGLVDTTSREPVPLVTVIVTSAIQRIQRRQYVRVKCTIPLVVIFPSEENPEGEKPPTPPLNTNTYDLSAIGVSIRSKSAIAEGTLLNIKLSLPDEGPPIDTPCRVRHCFAAPENLNIFHVGMNFLRITENNKARIVRFVYDTQLKRLRT